MGMPHYAIRAFTYILLAPMVTPLPTSGQPSDPAMPGGLPQLAEAGNGKRQANPTPCGPVPADGLAISANAMAFGADVSTQPFLFSSSAHAGISPSHLSAGFPP